MSIGDESTRGPVAPAAGTCFAAGGAMGDLVRAHDWAATSLGPAADWPPSLWVAVNLCLDSTTPMAVYAGDSFRIIYNDAFALLLVERHPWALGRPGFEVWAEVWHQIEPLFVGIVATGRGFATESQRFDLIRNARLTETYFQYSFNPLRDESGRVGGIFAVVTETTERVLAERRHAAEIERLRAMFEQAPGCIAVSRGPDHVFEIANRAYRRLMGDRPLVGLPVVAAVPELAAHGFVDLMDRVYTTGVPYLARRAEVLIDREPDGPAATHYFDFIYQPITDAAGVINGLFVEGTEVTEQVVVEARARADEARQTFRAELADALGRRDDPVGVMEAASALLGHHLRASRVTYAEVDGVHTTVTTTHEWSDGTVGSVAGQHRLADFGPIIAEIARGNPVAVDDVALDPRTRDHLASFRAVEIASLVVVGLIKNGQLVVLLSVHVRTPRAWVDDDWSLVSEVAERTWAAVERARAEAALRERESVYRSVVELASDGIWIAAPDGRYLDVNPAACAILGYTRDQYLTMTIGDVIPPGDRPRLDGLMARLLAGEKFQEIGNFRRRDGAIVPLELSLSCLPDGRPLAIGRDITERRRQEERDRLAAAEAVAAAEANAKFRALFDQGGFFAAILGLDGAVHEVNRLAAEGIGFARGDFVGREFWACPTWTPRAALAGQIRAGVLGAAGGSPFHEQLSYFVGDGGERYVDLHLTPVTDDAGRVLFIVASGVDITDRKRAEDELRSLAVDLSNADHRKDEFLAMLAHELRNPLGVISGAVQLAAVTDQAGPADEFRDLIGRQVVHLTRLIDDLLDVSRITQGKITLRPETVDLAATVGRAVEQVRPVVERKRHALTVALPAAPVRFVADSTRTEQILGNLLTNAAKYTEPGGRIDLDARVEGGEVVFRVRDTGVGIAAEMLPEVFGLFTQVDATIDRAQGGLGIGLTLVRNLVEMHGGTVSAASAGKGRGSEFTVRLPIGRPDAPAGAPERPPAPRAEVRPGSVLVVDDNLDTARLTARMLRHAGFEVATAHDGLAAVDLADRLRPSIVLLDIGLPGMNGYEVAATLRRHESSRDATLIAISGYGEEKARERSAAAGFDHHLTKPVDFAHLMALLGA